MQLPWAYMSQSIISNWIKIKHPSTQQFLKSKNRIKTREKNIPRKRQSASPPRMESHLCSRDFESTACCCTHRHCLPDCCCFFFFNICFFVHPFRTKIVSNVSNVTVGLCLLPQTVTLLLLLAAAAVSGKNVTYHSVINYMRAIKLPCASRIARLPKHFHFSLPYDSCINLGNSQSMRQMMMLIVWWVDVSSGPACDRCACHLCSPILRIWNCNWSRQSRWLSRFVPSKSHFAQSQD